MPSVLLSWHKKSADTGHHLFQVFFLYPLIGGCYLLASSWTTEVAQAAYDLQRGRIKKGDDGGLTSLAQGVSEFNTPIVGAAQDLANRGASTAQSTFTVGTFAAQLYRFLLIANYSLLGLGISKFTAALLPGPLAYIGHTLSFMLYSWIDAYYCFEQLYIARGWGFEKRARHFEMRWSYFVAFGVPSTAVSYFHSSGLLNLMLFMLVFPLCSMLALLADPQPHDGTIVLTLLPGRVPLFWPTVRIHRWLVRNVVRSDLGRFSLFSSKTSAAAAASTSAFARNAAAGTNALGSSVQSAFAFGKKSSAARFVGQVWNDAGGGNSSKYSYGKRQQGYQQHAPNGYVPQGAPPGANGFAAHGYTNGGGFGAGNRYGAMSAGYASYPSSPSVPPPLGPPPKGGVRRKSAKQDANGTAATGTSVSAGAANATPVKVRVRTTPSQGDL